MKIPLFPTTTPEEGFGLIRARSRKRGLEIPKESFDAVKDKVPTLLTPGAAADAVASRFTARHVKTENLSPTDALKESLADYQNPVPRDVMDFQIGLAVSEASDLDFVPAAFKPQTTA